MRRAALILNLGLGLATATAGAAAPPGQAVGSYSAGRLAAPSALPEEAPGLLHLFGSRRRGFGTEGLVSLLASAAAAIAEAHPARDRLQVGDLSAEGGGPISRHSSHQNGLDADAAYLRVDSREQPREHDGFDEAFVREGRLSPNFDVERNWALLSSLAAGGRAQRIFVDSEIKRALCRHALGPSGGAAGEAPSRETVRTLRALRPYAGHADHFHLRLTCPSESPACKPQEPPPPGTGCDSIEGDAKSALQADEHG